MKVLIDNILVNYNVFGQGDQDILLLHGWGSQGSSFDQWVLLLDQAKYRYIIPDLPGFGDSERPQEDWGIEDYAKHLTNFLQKLDSNPKIVLGHSMGGRIAIYLAANKMLKLHKLLLIGAHGFKDRSFSRKIKVVIAKLGKVSTSVMPVKVQEGLKRQYYQLIGSTDYLNTGSMKQIFLNIINQDLSTQATMIDIPTLLIYGSNDDQTPVSYGKQYNELIKDSVLKVIGGSGHYAFIDKPRMVAEIVREFIG
ncbi:alpha/beta hydrolase [Candidatus Saccharibacteria bacterium]|nr:alpha/beta hydrolase [Candidatus Saccharibacteria bacterium]MCB9834780.1 alpha/beta hydrolase [Candidatus Nomurabacteria bacterium]